MTSNRSLIVLKNASHTKVIPAALSFRQIYSVVSVHSVQDNIPSKNLLKVLYSIFQELKIQIKTNEKNYTSIVSTYLLFTITS